MKEQCIKDGLSFNRLIFARASGDCWDAGPTVSCTPNKRDVTATELLLICFFLFFMTLILIERKRKNDSTKPRMNMLFS